jgi:hypothetical protein
VLAAEILTNFAMVGGEIWARKKRPFGAAWFVEGELVRRVAMGAVI